MSGAFRDGISSWWSGSAVAGGVRQAAGRGDGPRGPRIAGLRGLAALPGGGHDGLVGEAELLVQERVGGAGAVVGEADDAPGVADELAPAHGDAGLDAHPGTHGRRQDVVLVRLVLV